jgi:hypothetical protein
VVSFMPRPLYSWGKGTRYPLHRKLKLVRSGEIITDYITPSNKRKYVRFEVSTAVTMIIIIFWEMIISKRKYVEHGYLVS